MTRAADLAKLIAGSSTLGGTGELVLKDVDTADGSSPKITFQTGDTDIAQDDVLGTIDFQAPDEGTGTDAILVSAGVEAKAEGDFSSSSNATSLTFKTGSSEAATEKVRIASDGNVMLGTTVAGRAQEGADRLTIADSGHSGMTIRSGTDNYGIIHFSDSEGGAGEYAGQIYYAHGSLGENLVFATQGSNRVKVTADVEIVDGNLKVANGHGVDFSAQTASSTATGGAEVLDHYEEGTFTPTWENVSNATFTVNLGRYTRIGREIACEIHLDINALNSASGSIGVSNLPFTMNSAANYYGHTSTIHGSGWNTNRIDLNGLVLPGTTRVLFYYIDNNGDAQSVDWASISTGNLLCKVMYLAP